MKILVPVLTFSRSGGARVLSEMASRWVGSGSKVVFYAHISSDLQYFPTQAEVVWYDNLGNLRSEKPEADGKTRKSGLLLQVIGLWLALMKRESWVYDVVLANHSMTAWPVTMSSRKNRKKYYYIQAYEPEFYESLPGVKACILKWLSEKSYNFKLTQICNAPIYLNYKKIRAKQWVPPGLDFNVYFPKVEQKDLVGTSEIILGCIGRKEAAKGTEFVLEAFKILHKIDERFVLHVAYGNLPDGWAHPGLKIVVPRNDSELAEFYRSLDIIIAPGTVQHGAPHYPVMEGMACGIPVVTTGYMPADETNAWIVNNKDTNAIVDAVLSIIGNHEDVRLRVRRALESISVFGWEVVSSKMLKCFTLADGQGE